MSGGPQRLVGEGGTPRSGRPPFALDLIDRRPWNGRDVLRLHGRWSVPVGAGSLAPPLWIRFGERTERLPALADPLAEQTPVPAGRPWRAAYVLPTGVQHATEPPRLMLAPPGAPPVPVAWPATAPAAPPPAAPGPDEAARRVGASGPRGHERETDTDPGPAHDPHPATVEAGRPVPASEATPEAGPLAALTRRCTQHPWRVVGAWVALVVLLTLLRAVAGSGWKSDYNVDGLEAIRGGEALERAFPGASGEQDTIVWHVRAGSVRDEAVRAAIEPMLRRVASSTRVLSVADPYAEGGAAQISPDGRTAYANVAFDGAVEDIDTSAFADVVRIADTARSARLQVELGGAGISLTQAHPGGGLSGEVLGLIAAAVILLFAFGSLVAAMLPIACAATAIGCAMAANGLLASVVDVADFSPTLASLIGLGVGVDYALFIVTRARGALKGGAPRDAAIAEAMSTSGRAVLFAGGTVCIALAGLLILGVSFLIGAALASIVAVLLAIAAASTLLPALLALAGPRVLSRTERRRPLSEGAHTEVPADGWTRWANFVRARPYTLGAIAVLIMVVISVPALSLRLGTSDAGNDPPASTTRKAYDLLAGAFGPGFTGPLQVVAELPSGGASAAQTGRLERLQTAVAGLPGVATVSAPFFSRDRMTAVLNVVPRSAPQDAATSELIDTLRVSTIPEVMRGSGATVSVGGLTAVYDDFAALLAGKLLPFLAVTIGLGSLLLLLAFRSLLVPLIAAVMNLAAAGAAFGAITAVFGWGWGVELLQVGGSGPVAPFVPVMLLAILFGLSTHYQVFLVSRMHEEWLRTRDNAQAVVVGQAATGRVITAAAAIMVFIFVSFLFQHDRVVAQFAVGLSAAVLLDALVVRTILVPGAMHALGARNWWIPSALERRLPHVSIERPGSDARA